MTHGRCNSSSVGKYEENNTWFSKHGQWLVLWGFSRTCTCKISSLLLEVFHRTKIVSSNYKKMRHKDERLFIHIVRSAFFVLLCVFLFLSFHHGYIVRDPFYQRRNLLRIYIKLRGVLPWLSLLHIRFSF